jgi:excisionase family DNA binding protein
MFLTPKEFANITGENYDLILELCKKGNLKCERTEGGHHKIYKSELEKYSKSDFISREDYEAVIRENEMLRQKLISIQKFINNILD